MNRKLLLIIIFSLINLQFAKASEDECEIFFLAQRIVGESIDFVSPLSELDRLTDQQILSHHGASVFLEMERLTGKKLSPGGMYLLLEELLILDPKTYKQFQDLCKRFSSLKAKGFKIVSAPTGYFARSEDYFKQLKPTLFQDARENPRRVISDLEAIFTTAQDTDLHEKDLTRLAAITGLGLQEAYINTHRYEDALELGEWLLDFPEGMRIQAKIRLRFMKIQIRQDKLLVAERIAFNIQPLFVANHRVDTDWIVYNFQLLELFKAIFVKESKEFNLVPYAAQAFFTLRIAYLRLKYLEAILEGTLALPEGDPFLRSIPDVRKAIEVLKTRYVPFAREELKYVNSILKEEKAAVLPAPSVDIKKFCDSSLQKGEFDRVISLLLPFYRIFGTFQNGRRRLFNLFIRDLTTNYVMLAIAYANKGDFRTMEAVLRTAVLLDPEMQGVNEPRRMLDVLSAQRNRISEN